MSPTDDQKDSLVGSTEFPAETEDVQKKRGSGYFHFFISCGCRRRTELTSNIQIMWKRIADVEEPSVPAEWVPPIAKMHEFFWSDQLVLKQFAGGRYPEMDPGTI
jgi:hypothetical protein